MAVNVAVLRLKPTKALHIVSLDRKMIESSFVPEEGTWHIEYIPPSTEFIEWCNRRSHAGFTFMSSNFELVSPTRTRIRILSCGKFAKPKRNDQREIALSRIIGPDDESAHLWRNFMKDQQMDDGIVANPPIPRPTTTITSIPNVSHVPVPVASPTVVRPRPYIAPPAPRVVSRVISNASVSVSHVVSSVLPIQPIVVRPSVVPTPHKSKTHTKLSSHVARIVVDSLISKQYECPISMELLSSYNTALVPQCGHVCCPSAKQLEKCPVCRAECVWTEVSTKS